MPLVSSQGHFNFVPLADVPVDVVTCRTLTSWLVRFQTVCGVVTVHSEIANSKCCMGYQARGSQRQAPGNSARRQVVSFLYMNMWEGKLESESTDRQSAI